MNTRTFLKSVAVIALTPWSAVKASIEPKPWQIIVVTRITRRHYRRKFKRSMEALKSDHPHLVSDSVREWYRLDRKS